MQQIENKKFATIHSNFHSLVSDLIHFQSFKTQSNFIDTTSALHYHELTSYFLEKSVPEIFPTATQESSGLFGRPLFSVEIKNYHYSIVLMSLL